MHRAQHTIITVLFGVSPSNFSLLFNDRFQGKKRKNIPFLYFIVKRFFGSEEKSEWHFSTGQIFGFGGVFCGFW